MVFNIPKLILGDFNLTRSPTDKNNANFSLVEATMFNDTINELGLMEILLLD